MSLEHFNKMVIQFNIPQKIFDKFKKRAKENREILAFLAGYKENDVVTVSKIIYPTQFHPRTEIEVVQKGKRNRKKYILGP